MKVAIPRERHPDETRVAATPETVGKLARLGFSVRVERGAGEQSLFPDEAYEEAGATLAADPRALLEEVDAVLAVRAPDEELLEAMPRGAILIGMLDPLRNPGSLERYRVHGLTAFSLELLPRITRAQPMDVLSSQSNLAGYRAVIDAAAVFRRAFPMMMTAAGTVAPARVLVMGAGVAGLQAIATARRLGAVVLATDVRPAAREQVESLGGRFLAVESPEAERAETAGGYAREMSDEYRARQAELVRQTLPRQEIVICTALVPGRPAPRLIDADMVRSMRPGSVIVDLAVEHGGNCELSRPGEVVEDSGVTILGYRNVPGRVPRDASALYARNVLAFVTTLVDLQGRTLAIDWEDELVRATLLTRDGELVHPELAAAREESAS